TTGRRPTRPLAPFFPFIWVAHTDITPQAARPRKRAQEPPATITAGGRLMRISLSVSPRSSMPATRRAGARPPLPEPFRAAGPSRSGGCARAPVRPRGADPRPAPPRCRLLQLDGRALLLQLGLDLLGLFLRHALLDRLRRVVDEVLRLLQAKAGQLAHDLDHLDLLLAGAREDDVELRLLLGRCRSTTGAASRRRTRRCDDRRHAELRLERLDELRQLEDGHVADGFEQLFLVSHCSSS